MKMQNLYSNTKLASVPLTILLVVAGLFGFVLLVPLAAHAAGPTVTVSPTSATVGSTITISGTGFVSNQPIAITSSVTSVTSTGASGTVTVDWIGNTACSPSVSYTGTGNSGTDSLVVGNCLSTDGTGSFVVQAGLPSMPGGPQTITIYDGTNTVTSTITVTPSLQMCTHYDAPGGCTNNSVNDYVLNSGYSETNTGEFYWLIQGFASADSVSISSSAFGSGYSFSCTVNSMGTCASSNSLQTPGITLADVSGGAKSVTATGATLTATTTFTILPWVNFYNSASGATTFSFLGTAPTSVLIEGHGFAASSTIAANSITIGGVATTHASVTTDSHGTFGVGAGAQLVVSPVSGVPYGPVNVVIAGTTFNFANGNINQGATGPLNIHPAPGDNAPSLGGVVIASASGTAQTTAVGLLDATTHTFGDNVWFFGYGFAASNAITITLTPTSSAGLPGISGIIPLPGTIQTTLASGPDSHGAIFDAGCVYTPVLPDTETCAQTGSLGSEVAGTYEVPFAQTGVANVVSPSYTTAAYFRALAFDTGDISGGTNFLGPNSVPASWCGTGTIAACSTGGYYIEFQMFAASSSVTATVGGNTFVSGSTTAQGTLLTNTYTLSAIDLASGTWTITGSDGTNTGTDTFVINPVITPALDSASALTVTTGKAGTVVSLLTTSGYGVHGLKANTEYSVNWGAISATGTQTLGSFKSTATGGIPVPGVQFTIPAGSVGNHVITLVQAGTDALLGNTLGDSPSYQGPTSDYGDVVFSESVSVTVTPTVAHYGSSVTLSGSGLSASTAYEITLSAGTSAPNNQILATFTTTASGNVPSGASFTVTSVPTGPATDTGVGACSSSTAYYEQATVYNVYLQTSSEYGGSSYDGAGTLVVAASVSLNMTSAPAGHAVALTGEDLCAQTTYNVVFNYAENSQATGYTGTVVGALLTDTNGYGTTTFTVPSSATQGTYPIQLVRVGTAATTLGVLSVAPTLTVGTSVSGKACTNLGTSCFTLSGSATKTTVGAFTGISASFTDSSTASVTGIVYAVVHNNAGQTVYYTTATISPTAGATADAFLVLSGLPPGTYQVSVFVTDTSGNAISSSTSVSVTLP